MSATLTASVKNLSNEAQSCQFHSNSTANRLNYLRTDGLQHRRVVLEDACAHQRDAGYGPFQVTRKYMQAHNPQVGGYYVVYKDGYASFSPAEAFEGGYTKI